MAQRKQFIPGSIFVRKGTTKITIKYNGKQYATGLNDTSHGRAVAIDMLKKMHYDFINFEQKSIIKSKSIYDAFELFIADHCKGLSVNTIRLHRIAFKAISPTDYSISEQRVNNDVLNFTAKYADLVNQYTISTYLRYYNVFINYCIKIELLGRTPDRLPAERKISRKKEVKRDVVVFEEEEFQKLIDYFVKKNKEYALLLLFLWNTGGRIAETLNLTWSHIDMKNRRIRYTNKVNVGEEDYIPLSSTIEEILAELRIHNRGEKVFSWQPSTQSRLSRQLNTAMQQCGIDKQDRGFHAIRRTFATNLFEGNVSLADVKDLMRHRDIKTTLEHYKAKKGQRLESILETNIAQSKIAPKLHP